MGKASRQKQERREIVPGGSYRTGLTWPEVKPIMLDHMFNGKIVLATRWTVEDARNMANGLLKFCEMAERKQRELQAAIAIGPTPPDA